MTDDKRSQEAEDVALDGLAEIWPIRDSITSPDEAAMFESNVRPILARLVREGQNRLLTACETFIRDRGHHEDEHVTADYRPCSKCEEAYIRAEAAFDSVVSETRAALRQEG